MSSETSIGQPLFYRRSPGGLRWHFGRHWFVSSQWELREAQCCQGAVRDWGQLPWSWERGTDMLIEGTAQPSCMVETVSIPWLFAIKNFWQDCLRIGWCRRGGNKNLHGSKPQSCQYLCPEDLHKCPHHHVPKTGTLIIIIGNARHKGIILFVIRKGYHAFVFRLHQVMLRNYS